MGGRGILWKTKQDPADWAAALQACSFRVERPSYYVPYKLRSFRGLLANQIASYFLKSRYSIVAYPV